MAQMSLQRLNELMRAAVESLQDERATLITFVDHTKPLLPESYWREQHERAVVRERDEATEKAAELFQRSLDIVRAKAKRQREDEELANASVDELLPDIPSLWKPDTNTSWGVTPMARSGGMLRPPTQGPQAPSYDFECYQCGRPITDRASGDWADHAGSRRCDGALMLDVDYELWHMPKPIHGEEEDEDA